MSLSVVIPNYNGAALVRKNLPKVLRALAQTPLVRTEKIVIVDDASTDQSVAQISALLSALKKTEEDIAGIFSIELVRNTVNRGFSSTVNRGVSCVSSDLVLILNTDVYPEARFLVPVTPHFKDPNVFAVGLLDKSKEDARLILRGRGIGWWEKGLYVHKRGTPDRTDTAWASGGSMVVNRKLFNRLKGFDEIYNPFYWEDIDLSYRATRAGYTVLFEPGSAVVHEHEKGAIRSRYSRQQITKIAYRNQFIFIWKNATLYQRFKHLLWMPYHVFYAILRRDWLFIAGWWYALLRILTYRR